MAEVGENKDLEEVLKPFYQRASEAEERLARLEAVHANKKGESNVANEKLSAVVEELQFKLKSEKLERIAEQEKARKELQKHEEEIAKLQYRITHLVRALEEADSKLGSKFCPSRGPHR